MKARADVLVGVLALALGVALGALIWRHPATDATSLAVPANPSAADTTNTESPPAAPAAEPARTPPALDDRFDAVLQRLDRLEGKVDALVKIMESQRVTPTDAATTEPTTLDLHAELRTWNDRLATALTKARDRIAPLEEELKQPSNANPSRDEAARRMEQTVEAKVVGNWIRRLERAADELSRVTTAAEWRGWSDRHDEVIEGLTPKGN